MSVPHERPQRGQALLAVASLLFLVGAMTWLDRIGPSEPARPVPGAALSGAWFCPHGGGSDLSVALYLANPGSATVTARITTISSDAAGSAERYEISPGTTLRIDQVPQDRAASTYVEYFGGWIGAGWVAYTDAGVAAEPCAADADRRWFLPDGTTQLGEDAYVIVANPFAVPAVMDVVLYTSDGPPIRASEWTDLVVPARRSTALHLNTMKKADSVVAAVLEVKVGRLAAASLGVSDGSRLRSALGWTQPATRASFPLTQSSGSTELVLLSTRGETIRFGATALTEAAPRPAGGLTEQEHGPAAARAYEIPVERGPVGIELFTLDEAPVAAALRVEGPGDDLGSTAGAVAASDSWVVLPAVSSARSTARAVLVNDGDASVDATVVLLPGPGGPATAPVTVVVPAHSAAVVPPDLWASAPGGAMLIRSEGGGLVALATSTSQGAAGADGYALSVGVPVPATP